MKLILTSVFALIFSLGFSQITKVEYEIIPVSHEGHGHHHDDDAAKRKEMLKNFDYTKFEADFVALGVPLTEKDGLRRHHENLYISKNFPEYFHVAEYKPKGDKNVPSKNSACPNAGFENLMFAPEWTGGIEQYPNAFTNTTIISNGLNALNNDPNSRHTILTIPPGNNNPFTGAIVGYDPLAINPTTGLAEIPFIAPFGGNASVRLGNSAVGSQKERLRYVVSVTPNNKAFYYQFAVIFDNPAGHTTNQQPYFKIRFMDSLGNLVGGSCGQYEILSSQAPTDPTYTAFANGQSYYRKWERVNVDLSPYIGQNITVEFESADCSLSGHYGYAYVDAGCLANLDATVNYCVGDQFAQLVAEPGFVTYQWFGPNSMVPIIGATNDTLTIASPTLGSIYTVEIGTSNGCIIVQNIAIAYSVVELDDLYLAGTCYKGNFGSANVTATGSTSGYNFTWVGPSPATATATNATGAFSGLYSGNYTLNIASNNPNCGQIDTSFIIPVVPPLIPQQKIAKFCEGEGIILAPGNGPFQWYTNDSIPIPAPAGTANFLIDSTAYVGEKVYLLYKLPNGCYDSIVYTFQDNISNSNFSITQNPGTGCRSRQIVFNDASPASNLINYVINGPNGFNATLFTTPISQWNYSGLANGLYTIRVVDDGCFYDTSFVIDDIEDSVTVLKDFCPNTPVSLVSASATGAHSWTDPAGAFLSNTPTFSVANPVEGTYIDSTLVSPGCYFITNFVLDSTSLVVSYIGTQPTCYGGNNGSIQGTYVSGGLPSSGTQYATTGPNGYTSTSNPANGMIAGNYTIVANKGGCKSTTVVTIGQPPFPPDTLWMYTQTCDELGQSVIYGPEGYYDYQWFIGGNVVPGQTGDTMAIQLPINYSSIYMTYTSPANGCQQKTSKFEFDPFSFEFNPDEYTNVFSPNNDKVNDVYYPVHSTKFNLDAIAYMAGEYSLKIFNRWGNLIYETKNYYAGWDGTSGGTPVEDGTYFAEIKYRTKCDTQENKVLQVVQVVR